ncbi:MAG: chorismate synthase [Bacteroidetes bacterium HGW-Bacteroidetes-12]|nr:MAG: chorismate synthase [Bacteroidetes bacterium HGW-Bacteroidetes-12]
MAGNTFGTLFKLTTFGESHGEAIGGIVDGCPAGLKIDVSLIQLALDRRKPGQSRITTQRKEEDTVEFLSGIFEGKTTGSPIGFVIKNNNQKTTDYEHIKDKFRPSHADFTYHQKYGIRDYRGGGRSSARETASRVVGGAIAQQILTLQNIKINAFVSQVGNIKLIKNYSELDLEKTYLHPTRCPDDTISNVMFDYIDKIRKEGDTVGGKISCVIANLPVGLGEPVFDRFEADLAKAMLSINATKGFEIGDGFDSMLLKGSEHNDEFYVVKNKVKTKSNHSGGVQGGITNGEDVFFNVAFKPVATIMKPQQTVNSNFEEVIIEGKGRHDPCVLPRAVAIVEAMTALVVIDHLLRNKLSKL